MVNWGLNLRYTQSHSFPCSLRKLAITLLWPYWPHFSPHGHLQPQDRCMCIGCCLGCSYHLCLGTSSFRLQLSCFFHREAFTCMKSGPLAAHSHGPLQFFRTSFGNLNENILVPL